MTLDELKAREIKYQQMVDAICAGNSVSHILGSDWGYGLPCTDKKAPAIALATEIFVAKFGDVTEYCGHQYRS